MVIYPIFYISSLKRFIILCFGNIMLMKVNYAKVKPNLAGWKTNSLSRAGRLTLINSNLTGMLNHMMLCFNCPNRLTKKMNKECRDFV